MKKVAFLLIMVALGACIPLSEALALSILNSARGLGAEHLQEADWWAEVQRNIQDQEYHITFQEKGTVKGVAPAYQAPNRAQNLRTYFRPEGIVVVPRTEESPSWTFRLLFKGFGRGPAVQTLHAPCLKPEGSKLSIERGALKEWYVNSPEGIEQGFSIDSPPRGKGVLWIDMSIDKGWNARLSGDKIELIDSEGVVRLQYGKLKVKDLSGADLEASLSVRGKSVRIEINDSGAAYPLLIDPIISLPPWSAVGGQAGENFGYSVSSAGDVNRDGYSDIVVGAPNYDNGQTTDAGRAFIYYGSAKGIASTPTILAAPIVQTGACFGYSVSAAGDVNGDGYADIIIAGPRYDNGQTANAGRAFLYYGSANGVTATPSKLVPPADQVNAYFGISVSRAGDVNGDGYSDVIIGASGYDNGQTADVGRTFLYYGSAQGITSTPTALVPPVNQANAYFGWSVSTAGDVNADGYADVIIGAYGYDNGQTTDTGRAYVYYGSTKGITGAPTTLAPLTDQAGGFFGWSVSTAGDVNGDGYADVIVGADKYDNGQTTDAGKAFLYYGSASGITTAAISMISSADQTGANFGWSVSTAGDVNGDGYADVIIAAPSNNSGQITKAGKAFLYYGSGSGIIRAPIIIAPATDQADARFGYSVCTAGDINGDGYSDIIIGTPFYNNGQTSDTGKAAIYYGSQNGLTGTGTWASGGNQAYAYLGWSVSTAGDVNGDGYADIVIGAPYYDSGQRDEGRVLVYYGSRNGLSPILAWSDEGNQPGALFGYSVSSAGDVNGDGYSDIIIGAPYFSNNHKNEGKAFVYHGSATGLSRTPNWTARGNRNGALFGSSVSSAGDVDADGFFDVIIGMPGYTNGQANEGAAVVYLGSAAGLGSVASWSSEGNILNARFGYSVSSAGDVNNDGYSDVIVGAPYYSNGQLNEGAAFVYHGSASGLRTTANWTVQSNQVGALSGFSVSTAGDVNGDRYSDVIVGAPNFSHGQSNEGEIFVYRGSASGLSNTPSWTAEINQARARFGWSVSSAGDVNRDGYDDVIIGAPFYDHGHSDEGSAFIYLGNSNGLGSSSAWKVESNQPGANLGWSVSKAGDVNGDGYSDVIIGAPKFDRSNTDEGRVLLYY